MTNTSIAMAIAGAIVIVLAIHSIITMHRRSIWPTIALIVVGCALLFEGLTLGIVKAFGG